jgi:hypothetical protein
MRGDEAAPHGAVAGSAARVWLLGQSGKRKWAADKWAQPNLIFPNIQTQQKLANSKRKSSLNIKISKFCMVLYLNILNNFLNWVNIKFSIKFML